MILYPFMFGLELASGCPNWPTCTAPRQTVNPPAIYSQAPSTTVYRPDPGTVVYHVQSSHPAVSNFNYQTVNAIGLNCPQKDTIVNYLEQNHGNAPVQPEQLAVEQRRLNSLVRSKIWQLRTYCP